MRAFTATLGEISPVLAALAQNMPVVRGQQAKAKPKTAPVNHHPAYVETKHRHYCNGDALAAPHRWTVFSTIPKCQYKPEGKICPVNVQCPSHASVGVARQ